MKKALLVLLVLGVIGGSVFGYYRYHKGTPEPTVNTAAIARGNVVDTVGATGTLQAVTTVQVGTQVSGTIQNLYADFNSLVKKGQVLARLDPSLFQTQIEQARANLIRAQADLERLKVSLDDARQKLARAQELSSRSLIPQSDLETAQVNVRSIDAQIRSSEAQVTQAQASLNQNDVNQQHTIIEAPIDGLVISRNVDVGQTVAASMSAPTLFILAADLTKMQVVANLDESDVGRIRPSQHVTFRVDAYPAEDFTGEVAQVRLQPIVQQNVVTYATVINVPNPQLKLKPGMTANVNIEIARRDNVLRVPNAALRFRPTNEIYAALGQQPPDPAQLRVEFAPDGGGRVRGQTAGGRSDGAPADPEGVGGPAPTPASTPRPQAPATAAATPAAPPTGRGAAAQPPADASARPPEGGAEAGRPSASSGQPAPVEGRGGRGGRGGGNFADRQNLSPEERERRLEQMRARGFDPTAAGGQPQTGDNGPAGRGRTRGDTTAEGRGRSNDQAARPPQGGAARNAQAGGSQGASLVSQNPGATNIDALFAPLPPVESIGRVWLYVDKQLKPVRVRVGISDGQATELIEGDLEEGTEVVTNVITGTETRPAAAAGGFPGLGQQPRGGFPQGGFPQGGGGNRGGGGGGRGR